MKSVVVGAGQGFYGDTPRGALDVARNSEVDYICFDALAELTMAILAKERLRDPQAGYTRDLPHFMRQLLPICREKGIRLISNAGGLNPEGAALAVAAVARELGMGDLRIGVVWGDDIQPRLDDLIAGGTALANMDTGASFDEIRDEIFLAVAYLGLTPLRRALEAGADVVITGRVADASLFAAPLAHEFNWGESDWDRLATGVTVGHLLECSAQASGGNFSGDWGSIPDMAHIGYPVCEVFEDGTAVLSKPSGSGGRVAFETVRQQLLYEVSDPARYLNPDVVADFTSLEITEIEADRVRLSGIRGAARPEQLKVVLGYRAGWSGSALLTYSWPQALLKAQKATEIIQQLLGDAGVTPKETCVEYLGANALHGAAAPIPNPEDLNEVTLRYTGRFDSEAAAATLARVATPLALNGPPFIGGGFAPAPPRALVGTWPALVDRHLVEDGVQTKVFRAGTK